MLLPLGLPLLTNRRRPTDPRTWHGGTPNVDPDGSIRIMLAHLYSAPWWHSPPRPLMPPSVFAGLSERGQELCRSLVGGDDIGPEVRMIELLLRTF